MSDPYAAVDPMIGMRIDRFIVQAKLAEGGMGAVYLAHHERLPSIQKVLKVLLPEYSRNPTIRQRFEREAEAAARLKHDHIIKIDSFGSLPDGQLFLMMPFLEGKPLDAYIREKGRFGEHRMLHIMLQVCSALQHMHDAGIVHRDLKPGNIFISHSKTNPYFVTLIDLGISKMEGDDTGLVTHTGMSMGTPAYMAVEQFEHAASVSPLADLYAAGIVTWEMLTGQLPWGMHTAPVLYRKQMDERPIRPSEQEISPLVAAILLAALSVRPADRPPSMRAFAVALASAIPALPPHVPSGAEILADLAPEFVQQAAPGDETVRNKSNQDRVAPLLWPPRETHAELPSRGAAIVPLHSPTPVLAPTINERPDVRAANPTTLTASNGASVVSVPAPGRGRLVALALGACALAGVATFALVRRSSAPGDMAGRSGAPMLGPDATTDVARPSAAKLNEMQEPVATHPPADAAVLVPAVVETQVPSDAALPDAPVAPGEALDARAKASPAIAPHPKITAPVHSPKIPVMTTIPAKPPVAPGTGSGSDRRHGSGHTFDPNAVGGEE